MIDVKIIKKPKNKATTPTVRTPGAAYGDKSVKEAVHASKADMAKMAEKASLAEQAEHAKKADEATRADEAEHAKSADEANHAKTADEVNLESKTLSHFLRNDIPNTAVEVVTFLKGVIAKAVSYFKGIVNDGDINNSGTITTKNINVTGKATFFELEIQKAKAAGGMTVNSAGTFHVDAVEETADGFVCYQRAEKDGVMLLQTCEPKDQMMCSNGMNSLPLPLQGRGDQTNDGKPHAIGNHYYWRLATDAPKKLVIHTIDGKEEKCLKLVLSKTDRQRREDENPQDIGDIPKVGDDLVQIGNRDNKERQSVMMSCAYNSFDPELKPSYWAHYMGVNDYEISKHRYTWFAANGSNVTGNFKVQSDDGGLESIEDYVKGLADEKGKDTVVWQVAFSIRHITDKQGETFRLKVVRIVGDKAEEVDYAAIIAAGADLLLMGDGMGAELRVEPGVDYQTAHYGSGRYLTARVVRYGTEVTLAQDTIYAKAVDGKPGRDAITYKLIPLAEEAVAYITEDKKNMIYISLAYKIQKAVGEQVSIVTDLRTEDMTLTAWTNKMETFELEGDEYGLSYSMEYDKMYNDSCVVTLKKGSDIVDQRIVPVTFKPKVVFNIDTKLGMVSSEITNVKGNLNSFEQDIEKTKSTVGNLEKDFTQIKQTSKEISLTVNNGTRPNLLWGSDLNLDGVDTTNKAAIQKHLGVELAAIGFSEWFEYLKGGGVAGADAIHIKNVYKSNGWIKWTNVAWKTVPLKPHTKYTISVWVKFKSHGESGCFYVDCTSDDNRYNFGGYLYSDGNYTRSDIDEWKRMRYVFDSGDSSQMRHLFFACISDEREGAQCELWLCRPKLEEGDTATPWCEYDGTVEELLAGGFDIKNREFTATADNFKVQNNKGEWTFLVDENGHINAKLISAESISAQKIAQPFVEQQSFGYLMKSPSLSWYITNGDNINNGYILASELNGAVLNIYNYTDDTIRFYSTFAAGKTTYPIKTVNVRVEIEPGAMFRAFGVPIKGVEMTTHEGTTTLVALAPLVPMELTSLSGDVRAKYRGSVKGFLTVR